MKKTISKVIAAAAACAIIFAGCGGDNPGPQPVSMGILDKAARTYESEYGGFGCKIPEEFEIMGLEDSGEDIQDVKERLSDTELKDISDNLDTISELQVTNERGDNYSIGLQELSDQEWQMTADEFIDSILDNKDEYISSYEASGAEITDVSKGSRLFLGKKTPTVETTASLYGMTLKVSQLLVEERDGKYVVVITLVSMDDSKIDQMLSDFYEL